MFHSLLVLNDNEEMALIDILVCACKQAFTRQGPPGRTSRKGKEKKASMDERKNLSAHLMPTLPRLLNKVSDRIIIIIGIVYVYAVISIPIKLPRPQLFKGWTMYYVSAG